MRLKPWEERHSEALHVRGVMATLQAELSRIPEAVAFRSTCRRFPDLAPRAGFNFMLQDRSGTLTVQQLGEQAQRFMEAARKRPELANLFTSFNPNYPQVKVELDREKARKLGVPVNEVFQAMSAVLGGSYVNDFNRFGRLFRVYVQSEADFRRKPKDIGDIYVRSGTTKAMIPLSTLVTITSESGTEVTFRFNLFRTVEITGISGPGYSSGQSLAALEEVFAADHAAGDGFCLLRNVLPREDRAGRGTDVCSRYRVRILAAGRACTRAGACHGRFCSARRWLPWDRSSGSG